ncbi:MAG: DUF3575 domain-containing protein [Prevotellaceae bacterium]|jgi:hypothetical protein|nr:DUF3575 domain-containing protein [Prevotellaceae bacterium]
MKNKTKCKIACKNIRLSCNTSLKAGWLFFGIIIFQTSLAYRYDFTGQLINEPKNSISEIAIHFPINQSRLLKNYSNNSRVLDELDNILRDKYLFSNIDSIVINGYASPDGAITNNLLLAEERAQSVMAYITHKYPQLRSKIIMRSQLVDLQAIRRIIANDYSIPFREEAEMVVNRQDITDIQRFRLLKAVGGGAALNYINRNYSAPLRRATGIMFYGLPKTTEKAVEQTIILRDTIIRSIVIRDTVSLPCKENWHIDTVLVKDYEWIKKPLFAVKTNLLFDLGTALNVEIEVPIGKRWSILGEYIFPWWLWESKQYALQVLSANLEGRYWFWNHTDRQVLTGWFAGLYAGGGYYDIEWRNKGYQGEFFIAAGLSGGYAHTLGKNSNFRMEYALGVGYLRTNYREYVPVFGIDDEWHLIRQKSGTYTWIGPTRVKVSLVWMLNYKSYNRK